MLLVRSNGIVAGARLAAVFIAAAATTALAAPPGELFAVSFWQTPDADFGDGARLSARTQRLDWRAAPFRVGDVEVSLGASYDYTRFEYSDVPSRDRDLHRVQLPVLMQVERGAWLWRVALAPGVATSSNVFKDLFARGTSDDAFATCAIDATRAVGDTTLSAGVAIDRRFGRSRAYPRIAVRGAGDGFSWQLGAPDAWLDWRAGQHTTLGIGVAPAGMQWHVVRDDFGSEFDYRQRRWDIRVHWRRALGERFAVSLHAGRAFDRRHRFEADAGAPIAGDVEDAWSFGLRIGYGDVTRGPGYAEAW